MTTAGRLRGQRTFAALAQHGHTVRSGPLRVRFVGAPVDTAPGIGFAIGKSTGSAVLRNRVRRRLRAAIASQNHALTSGSYLISADATVATMPFSQLCDALSVAFEQIQERATA